MSFAASGGGGTIGVSVLRAVWPIASVTWYVTAVFVPGVMVPNATKVARPVALSKVHVPSPRMTNVSSASQASVAGLMRHVSEVLRLVPVAKGVSPVMLLYTMVPLGITCFTSGVAAIGGNTVTMIVAVTSAPVESSTWYVTAGAVPLKVGSGSKVTVPLLFTE